MSNTRLDVMVQRQSTELEEPKNMFRSFIGNHTVSSNVVIESHTGQALDVPRGRDIQKKWKKILRPDSARVRPRHRLEEFLRDYKSFCYTSGTIVTATEAECANKNKKGKKRQRLVSPETNVSEENEEENSYSNYTSWRKIEELCSIENEELSSAEDEEMSVEKEGE
ncbi:unnamed protein product [Rhizopus stolonifer]